MSGDHASERLITAYARGVGQIADDEVWGLESHLESCAGCRARLAEAGPPAMTTLLDGVWAGLQRELATPPMPSRRRWASGLATWASPAMASWVGMVVLTALIAVGLDRLRVGGGVPVLLLLAPVLPVLGVVAVWARGLDPAFELIAATPRAGLRLVTQRTLAVLVVLFPVLLAAGWATDTSIAPSLLPALAFTAGTLALGTIVGVSRAAVVLLVVWAMVIFGPALAWREFPAVLRPELAPLWVAVLLAASVITVVRRAAFTTLAFRR